MHCAPADAQSLMLKMLEQVQRRVSQHGMCRLSILTSLAATGCVGYVLGAVVQTVNEELFKSSHGICRVIFCAFDTSSAFFIPCLPGETKAHERC